MPRVFLVTGTSTGFGYHLVQETLDNGNIAVATARKPESLSFTGTSDKNYLALKLDVTKDAEINAAFKATLDKFGRVDVVVNNAGCGVSGPFEELTPEQIRTQMEVNFFGLIRVATFSSYCASKWAVEGFTESVVQELKPERGINLTCVEPGGFRTDWAGRSMVFAEKRHPAYDHLNAKEIMTKRNGTQAGDPKKGGRAIYQLAVLEDPPLRVVIGSDATIMSKIETYAENYKKFEKISNSTDVEE